MKVASTSMIMCWSMEGPKKNMIRATLERAKEVGVTFKLSKSTFCQREVRWFRRVFSQTGVSADPDKITKIVMAGRPESFEDIRSFLQAASYNARFAFAHEEDRHMRRPQPH